MISQINKALVPVIMTYYYDIILHKKVKGKLKQWDWVVGLGYVVKSIFALVVIIFIANYSLKIFKLTFMTKKRKAIRNY